MCEGVVLNVTGIYTPLPADIDDLCEVLLALGDLKEWNMLGMQLGLRYPTPEKIKHDHHYNNHYIISMLINL